MTQASDHVTIDEKDLKKHVRKSLTEDLGNGDITTSFVPNSNAPRQARILAKETGVLHGNAPAGMCFSECHKHITNSTDGVNFTSKLNDGDQIEPRDTIATIQAPLNIILAAERVSLNYLQQLSGVATYTHDMVEASREYNVDIYDTRKTIPHFRKLQKQAVLSGGGKNHRLTLSDAVMIKDTHKKASGGLIPYLEQLKTTKPVIIEIHTLDELEKLNMSNFKFENFDIDVIMLDNISPSDIRNYADRIPDFISLEVSGGVSSQNVDEYAQSGVDRISIGALTHSFQSIDLSLELVG